MEASWKVFGVMIPSLMSWCADDQPRGETSTKRPVLESVPCCKPTAPASHASIIESFHLFMKLWRLQSVCEVCITTSVSDQSQATVPPRRKEAVFILRPLCCLPSRLPSSRMTPNDRDRVGTGSSFQKMCQWTQLVHRPWWGLWRFGTELRVKTTFAMSCRCLRTLEFGTKPFPSHYLQTLVNRCLVFWDATRSVRSV
ncbi:hypothetical protein D6C78_00034 [Aureobasidium pullulans]|uniref:Uncharacterized protein n=1 Tax=Aureobasidium pullulans TaxID=5580 RepID=A0A4S8UGR0_AURPU|nr:hypothetical protein D6D27_02283 [Aureobasidium pullulans]TIA43836.1 hypothetical protein D6C78_00034 [Aureobasidium pullulans]